MDTNLVVADKSRTNKTICLAVTPSLKQYGISGRARLFDVVKKVKDINYERRKNSKNYKFTNKSYFDSELKNNNNFELDYIVAPPNMGLYIKYSTAIYNVYLKFLSKEDIFVYSIDEVFCDITTYLETYKKTPEELVSMIIKEVYNTTGITATAGIGTNLYLAKIAMDIEAKHKKANDIGVRIAYLDEQSYRKNLWNHKPISDFWRVGAGYRKKLEANNLYTMGDIALCSINNEELLYKLFGINAELLIDHAWGYEPCTMESIKSYRPRTNSISSGQVLKEPYDYKKTKIIIKEMTQLLTEDLVRKKLIASNITLTIGYDIENIINKNINYNGEITIDHYGRKIPKHAHGSTNLEYITSSSNVTIKEVVNLYERIINKNLLIRRINISFNNLEHDDEKKVKYKQINLFSDYEDIIKTEKYEKEEKKIQEAIINIKQKYGKNSILKGMNLEDGATTIERNNQIGGHKK